jgi:hypothetical protein
MIGRWRGKTPTPELPRTPFNAKFNFGELLFYALG